jgi:hypothetical protein
MTSIIEVLGEQISKALNIKSIQAKGLLRLAIKDVMPDKPVDQMSLKDIKVVLNQGLTERLNKIGMSNSAQIVKELVKYITANQSLITIIKI